MTLRSPQTIGRYEVIGPIGEGGSGIVYRARDPRIARIVAIKVLRVDSGDLRDRFEREARSAGSLNHANIVTIFDFGEHEGQPFIVMEFVQGETLAQQIRNRAPLPLSTKFDWMDMLSGGLEYAHRQGVIHRDIKPANLMIDRSSALKILDFGIARLEESGATRVGMLIGTPNYMSPEQVEGRPLDLRSDIFSVGAVFYELLSYRRAFASDSLHAVLDRVLNRQPEPLSAVCPDLHPDIEAVVVKALAKNPAERYQTLGALRADLARCRVHVTAADHMVDPAPTVSTSASPPRTRGTPRSGHSRELLSRRRAEQIETRLKAATEAFEAGNYEGAMAACDEALLLDPDEPRALDLNDRAREAGDRRKAIDLLVEAQKLLRAGDAATADALNEQLAAAEKLIDQAFHLDPDATLVGRLQQELARAQEKQRKEDERRQRIEAALEAARTNVAQELWDDAFGAASQALGLDPRNAEAREISRQALAAIDERHAIEARERERAREEKERQEREAAEVERLRIERERWLSDRLASAQKAINDRRLSDAIASLEQTLTQNPDAAQAIEMLAAARTLLAAEEEQTRRRREREARLAEAKSLIASRRLDDAAVLIDSMLKTSPSDEEALLLRAAAQTALEQWRAEIEAKEVARVEREAEAARLREDAVRLKREQQAAEAARRAEEVARSEREAEAAQRREDAIRLKREQEAEAARRAEEVARSEREAEAARRREDAARLKRERDAETRRRAEEFARRQREEQAANLAEEQLRLVAGAASEPAGTLTHPVPVFISTTPLWRRPMMLTALGLVVVLGTVVAIRWPRPSAPTERTQTTTNPGTGTTNPSTPTTGPSTRETPELRIPPAATPTPPPSAAPASAPAPSPSAPVDRLAALRPRLGSARNDRELLDVLTRGLRIDAGDVEFSSKLGQLRNSAEARATRTRAEADKVNGRERAKNEYAQGLQQLRDGQRDTTPSPRSVERFLDATDLLEKAIAIATVKAVPEPPPTAAAAPTTIRPSEPPAQAQREIQQPEVQLQRPLPSPPAPQPRDQIAPPPANVAAEKKAADTRAIQELLAQYVGAFNRKDSGAIGRLVPGRPPDFSQVVSYHVELGETRIEIEGDTATVNCVRQIEQVSKRGGTKSDQQFPTTFRLRRAGTSWAVESVR